MKEIELTQGYVALVDDEDYEYLCRWNWCVSCDMSRTNNYAVRKYRVPASPVWKAKRMHREILEINGVVLGNHEVDHINGNGLDNRKLNLRVATHAENTTNSQKRPGKTSAGHPFKGVTFVRGGWRAQIVVGGKFKSLGCYNTPDEAASAYDNAAVNCFGEFARTNTTHHLWITPEPSSNDVIYSEKFPKKNKRATSRYRGVTFQRDCNRWRAQVVINHKIIYLGLYRTEEMAARAYNEYLIEHDGDMSKLNKFCVD